MKQRTIYCPRCGRVIPKDTLEGKSAQPKPACPQCGSLRNFRNGLRNTDNGRVQTYLSHDCGRRFTYSKELHLK